MLFRSPQVKSKKKWWEVYGEKKPKTIQEPKNDDSDKVVEVIEPDIDDLPIIENEDSRKDVAKGGVRGR